MYLGKHFKAAASTEWFQKIAATALKSKKVRSYDLYYTFGAAPRDISNFSRSYSTSWKSIDGKTSTGPNTIAEGGAIESYITTKDGVDLAYRLEGSSDPSAPLIILSNSILVNYSIWTPFIQAFLASPTGKSYRILRYNTRGRTSNAGSLPVNIDLPRFRHHPHPRHPPRPQSSLSNRCLTRRCYRSQHRSKTL